MVLSRIQRLMAAALFVAGVWTTAGAQATSDSPNPSAAVPPPATMPAPFKPTPAKKSPTTKPAARPEQAILEAVDIAPVWAGHPVGFCLITRGDYQYVAFYDKDRRMTVAKRPLGSSRWTFASLHGQVPIVVKRSSPKRTTDKPSATQPAAGTSSAARPASPNLPLSQPALPTTREAAVVGWDSHNYIAMAFDADGQLHVFGNMHASPLVYFRTTRAQDITSFEQVPHMVGNRELSCTYPRFIDGPNHEFIFAYRDGRSGNGADLYNVYDTKTRTWSRLFDAPLTDGLGRMNAYCCGPRLGPDGYFHLCWVWRNSPDCSTNHDLSYARSKDLIHWETSYGKPLTLPITLETGEIVDPVPMKGGIINNTKLGFDSAGRVILSYHKIDADGHTQIYNARREETGWKIVRASQWSDRWDFNGGGSIASDIDMSPVTPLSPGQLMQTYRHKKSGGAWLLDEQTLLPVGPYSPPPSLPHNLGKVESTFPGMQVRFCPDTGQNPRDGGRYLLRWETLPPNRDRPIQGDPPAPSMLRVYRIMTPETKSIAG